MKKIKNHQKEKDFDQLQKDAKIMAKNHTLILAAQTYTQSQEIITTKISNENSSLIYGISQINKKVIDDPKKYKNVEEEIKTLMTEYQEKLEELAKYHDTQIVSNYVKLYEEEMKLNNLRTKKYYLIQDEKKAKAKVDNSDDIISEQIYNLEDEIDKIELKIRRLRPQIKKKIQDKEEELFKAIESNETDIDIQDSRRPKIFSKAKKFFSNKLKPYKAIEKNIFGNLKTRLTDYELEQKPSNIRINEDYLQENIIKTLNSINEN